MLCLGKDHRTCACSFVLTSCKGYATSCPHVDDSAPKPSKVMTSGPSCRNKTTENNASTRSSGRRFFSVEVPWPWSADYGPSHPYKAFKGRKAQNLDFSQWGCSKAVGAHNHCPHSGRMPTPIVLTPSFRHGAHIVNQQWVKGRPQFSPDPTVPPKR